MKLIIKGFIIGVGKILPGISGSVLAISLNEYKNIINSLNNWNKKNMFYLMKIGIGMILAIIILSKILFGLIDKYSFYMFSIFLGLILGTLPKMVKKIDRYNFLYLMMGFFILYMVDMINISVYPNIYIRAIIMGIIESLSTIIPGISGTAILTKLGLYKEYLLRWSKIYDLGYFGLNLGFYIPFIATLVIISILIIKSINYLLNNHESKSNGLICGFIIASIILIFKRIYITNILIFIVLVIIGFMIGYYLDHISN